MISDSQKKYYASLDIMKFFMALAIMSAHIASENVTIHPVFKMITSIYNFGVPFFFSASGFLFFLKVKDQTNTIKLNMYKSFSKRILLMYFIWSLIYFVFVLTNWIQDSTSINEILKYFHHALVITTYGTIWFLPALWIGVSIVFYLLYKNWDIKYVLFFSIIMYIIGSFGFSYKSLLTGSVFEDLIKIYNLIFVTSRNGLFAAFPFIAIGAFLTYSKSEINRYTAFLLTLLFCALFIVEAFFIKTKLHSNVDMGILLIPSIYFLMIWLLKLKLNNREIYVKLRNLSMLIFLSQRLFITAIPSILTANTIYNITKNPYLGFFIFSGSTVLFSIIINRLSDKYKWLKVLW